MKSRESKKAVIKAIFIVFFLFCLHILLEKVINIMSRKIYKYIYVNNFKNFSLLRHCIVHYASLQYIIFCHSNYFTYNDVYIQNMQVIFPAFSLDIESILF